MRQLAIWNQTRDTLDCQSQKHFGLCWGNLGGMEIIWGGIWARLHVGYLETDIIRLRNQIFGTENSFFWSTLDSPSAHEFIRFSLVCQGIAEHKYYSAQGKGNLSYSILVAYCWYAFFKISDPWKINCLRNDNWLRNCHKKAAGKK